MFVPNIYLRTFQDFPIGNFWSAKYFGKKMIHFCIGNGALFRPQFKQKRNTMWAPYINFLFQTFYLLRNILKWDVATSRNGLLYG